MEDDKPGVPSPDAEVVATPSVEVVTETGLIRRPPPPPPPSAPTDPEDEEEDRMLRMSFMEHLEELRNRIIRALYGLGIAFLFALIFAGKLWDIVSDPAVEALTPMEGFSIIWVELPLLASVLLASPWIVYQLWAFISPGLYKKERRLALPFVLLIAGLFIGGGFFAYFLAFR